MKILRFGIALTQRIPPLNGGRRSFVYMRPLYDGDMQKTRFCFPQLNAGTYRRVIIGMPESACCAGTAIRSPVRRGISCGAVGRLFFYKSELLFQNNLAVIHHDKAPCARKQL